MDLPCERIGPYRLTRWIGSGGIGHVFAAVHEQMDQEVALKLLSQESASDPELVARFVQEARALAGLQHPGVVRALYCDRLTDGTAYLAMEYLEGATLRQWLTRREGPAHLDAALFIVREIADAMIEVHDRGIVHRDLKPENIMLIADVNSPIGHRVKLLDFGVAKVPHRTGEGQVNTHVQTGLPAFLGTAAYMAPEQCRNVAEVTDRTDVYSLGLILFELITGNPPFESDEPVELMSMHMQVEPPHLEQVAPDVSPALGAFVSSMIAKDPSSRPSMARCREMLARPWQEESRACPFPGLAPFTGEQAELFFGRQDELKALEAMFAELSDGGACWLQIEGPGGSGKTSFVQAAVLPGVQDRFAARSNWFIASLRPAADPISSLARAVASLYGAEDLEATMRADDAALASSIRHSHPSGSSLLLVIDQLEELFTLGARHIEQFDGLLFNALTAPDSPVRLLTTLRSDHAHRLGHLPRLASLAGRTRRYYLKPIEEGGLLEAIRGMTSRVGLRLSDGLAERIVQDAVRTDSRMPLLGHVLRSLWSARPGLVLTHDHYDRIGGIGGALLQQANGLLEGLGEDGRSRAKWLLLDLVRVGRGTPDTRRSRVRAEVIGAAGGDQLAEEILVRLSGGSTLAQASPAPTVGLVVLAAEHEVDPSRQRVDLVHDTLLRQVPALAAWIDGERELLERHADLEAATDAWHQAGCPTDGLPTGFLLEHLGGLDAEARRRGRLTPMTGERTRRFLRAARDLQRRRSRVRRVVAAALVVSVVAIVAIALHAWQQRRRAEASLQSVILTTKQVVSDTDWKLGRVLYTLEARRAMLQHIDESLASLPEVDRASLKVIIAIAETKHRRSDLARLNESLSRAEAFIEEARGQIDKGLERDRSNHGLVWLAAVNHSKRGKIALARGRSEEARAEFAESVAVLRRIEDSDDDDSRRTLATSYAEYAEAEIALSRFTAAATLADAAVDLLGRNDSDYDRSQLALAVRLRGVAARDAGDLRTAAARLEQAQSVQAPLLEHEPGNAYYRWILATIRADLAAVRRREGRLAEADEILRWARDVADELHRTDPTQKDYALLLCRTLRDSAEVAELRGDRDAAAGAHMRACEIATHLREKDSEDERFRHFPCL
jgi:eukaryotic-like serine/threonine-protein kinase